jgi:MFS family permease
MVIGNYLCYDIPAVLERELQDNLGISELEYNLLYTVYSVPNIFIPLCGGLLIDYIGIKRSLILFNVPLIVGQCNLSFTNLACCVLGAWTKNYIYLIIGRIIFGLGAENLCVVQSTIVSKWFAKREIAFAMGY